MMDMDGLNELLSAGTVYKSYDTNESKVRLFCLEVVLYDDWIKGQCVSKVPIYFFRYRWLQFSRVFD